MVRSALVAGATGIVGNNLARHLRERGWPVYGLARRPGSAMQGILPLTADLLEPPSLQSALRDLRPTHVFFCTWLRQKTEAENILVNSAMLRNLLDVLSPIGSVRHVALVTGLKHYLGPFESYGQGTLPATPFREDQPRLDVENFYYAQEDEVFAASKRDGFTWSIHRPHTIIGYAVGNAMNLGTTLATYATIQRETGRPFLFPGSAIQWNALTDMTDARLLARYLEWAATTDTARNQALNVVNGDVFRWRWMWGRLADWFGLRPAAFLGDGLPLERQMGDAGPIWSDIARKHQLAEPDLNRLTSAWHTDADLGRPIEVVTDMTKSRRLGFLDYQPTDESFFDLFTILRQKRIIP
ncbi:NAD-dependent dehydratase [Bradyrhizobium japonicum]|uniref:NAD-dependent dehydratase n=1 Tax=Bradyrhizobium japonicum TaxID=375 RepID=A0A1Y2JUW9_BRAJP|nr:SDR family oxidoreductase [Bradyrhizobium japonicum]OSJ35808.1 NAD-dependent dehydratase [Bradyrhizobium japonicum]